MKHITFIIFENIIFNCENKRLKMAQMQQTSGVMMPKISYASTMIVEDHLKKLLASTSNKPFKASNNKLLPRAQHSPFGDFPNEFLPKKQTTVTDFKPIDKHEQSIAAKGVRKFNKYLYHV